MIIILFFSRIKYAGLFIFMITKNILMNEILRTQSKMLLKNQLPLKEDQIRFNNLIINKEGSKTFLSMITIHISTPD